jgi:hypothetical protein
MESPLSPAGEHKAEEEGPYLGDGRHSAQVTIGRPFHTIAAGDVEAGARPKRSEPDMPATIFKLFSRLASWRHEDMRERRR